MHGECTRLPSMPNTQNGGVNGHYVQQESEFNGALWGFIWMEDLMYAILKGLTRTLQEDQRKKKSQDIVTARTDATNPTGCVLSARGR